MQIYGYYFLRLSVKMKGFDAWDAQKRKCADFQIAG
jgi:hypothetical protein